MFPLNCVRKAQPGKYRLTTDARYLNLYSVTPKFKLEDLRDLPAIASPGDWFTSIDLTDAFFHVPLKPEHWTYFGIRCKGVTYCYTCLPFGFAPGPLIFSKVMREVVGMLRSEGIRILPYLDDFLVCASSEEQCRKDTCRVLEVFKNCGLQV